MSEAFRWRAMGLGDVLDEAIGLYRRHFVTFVAVVAVLNVPIAVLRGLWQFAVLDRLAYYPEEYLPFPFFFSNPLSWGVLLALDAVAVNVLLNGALAGAVSDLCAGRGTSVERAYRRLAGRLGALLGAMGLIGVADLGLLALSLIPCLGWVGGPMLLVYANLCWAFVPQTVVVEGCGPLDGLRRSWQLVRDGLWRVVGLIIVLYLFGTLLVRGLTGVAAIGLALLEVEPRVHVALIVSAVSLLLGILYTPLRLAAMTLLYFDARVRREGYDLEVRAREILAATGHEPHPGPGCRSREPLFARRDAVNVVTLLGVALALVMPCYLLWQTLLGWWGL